MGCTNQPQVISLFPDPQGKAENPLEREGDIIVNITNDPHIQYFQTKIEEVLLPLRKNKRAIKNITEIERYATTDKKDHEKYVQSINEAI